jgi:hypothetical protein
VFITRFTQSRRTMVTRRDRTTIGSDIRENRRAMKKEARRWKKIAEK